MLAAHGRLASESGMSDEQIVLAENGSVVELTADGARIVDEVEAGVVFVDGLSVGDISDVALRDRRHLSEDGVLIIVATLANQNGTVVSAPELIARGFPGNEPLLEEMRAEARRIIEELLSGDVSEIKLLQEHLHDGVGQLVYDRTKRRPMILPVVVEV
jgi:ribonuclease J